jgi:hypothetical protein
MNIARASVWNVGTHGLMKREYVKRQKPQDESTDAAMGAEEVVAVKRVL